MKNSMLAFVVGSLIALPLCSADPEIKARNPVQDCLMSLTEVRMSDFATTTYDGAGANDGFAVWTNPNIELAYFDYQWHTEEGGQVTEVDYIVTGLTEQVSCSLASLCPTVPSTDLVVSWMAEVRQDVEEGNVVGLPVPNVCDLT